MREGYDIAQICANGHVASSMAGSHPDFRQKYCDKCGEGTVTVCSKCGAYIRGHYHVPGVFGGYEYEPPAYCFQCGAAFPWTERKQKAAIDLFIEETQDLDDRREFEESVGQIAKDTPQAQVASRRITRLLGKVSKSAAHAIRDILVGVASEVAKKGLMP
jgi:hypothetical protein